MTPYSETVFGETVIETSFGRTVNRRPAVITALFDVSSIAHGDHKSPYPQTFTKTQQITMTGKIFQSFSDGPFFSSVSGVLPGFPNPSNQALFDDNVYNKALSNLYEKLRGSADLAVDIAEINQTKAMMVKTVKGLNNFTSVLRSMRRMKFSQARDAYLEWTYGWKPLASSIYETGKQLQKQLLQPQRSRLTIEARASGYSRKTTTIDYLPGVKIVTTMETSNRVRFVTNWKLGNDMNDVISSFTSLNPVAIAWELVPYSFVVDWCVDIGGYLRNLETAALYNSSFLNGYVTLGTSGTSRSVLSGRETAGSSTTSYEGRCSNYTRRKIRTPFAGEAPFPRNPSFELGLTFDRLTSAAALASQAIGKLRG